MKRSALIQDGIPSNQKFGLLFSAIFLGVSTYFLWHDSYWLAITFQVLTALFVFLTVCAPFILAPLNRAWFALSLLLGKLVSPIVLSAIFFVVIVPVALATRLLGRDALFLKKRNVTSYWVDKAAIEQDSFKNQF
jgi:hypothetical protein